MEWRETVLFSNEKIMKKGCNWGAQKMGQNLAQKQVLFNEKILTTN
jgi:hypothetical protein